jgi:hypothetical protein
MRGFDRFSVVRVLVAGLLGLLWLAQAEAHKASDSYLSVDVSDAGVISGQWDIALRDLDFAIGLDADGDGNITWGETRAKHADIAAYALARLDIEADGAACTSAAPEQLVDQHTDGAYTVLRLQFNCPPRPGGRLSKLTLNYQLFADLDPQHRGLLKLTAGGQARTAIFSPEARRQVFVLQESTLWRQFLDYAEEGVWHIWTGYDHILFLLSLLLPAVLVWQAPKWVAAQRFAPCVVDVAKIVTAFTLAHSITLSLATLGFVSLPSRLVESVIAASVVLAALNNLWPLYQGRRWMVAFVFGLIHGFGFAAVLADLGLPQNALLLALVGFNLGVEGGQLAIVGLFLPLAYLVRRGWFYPRVVLRGGSAVIAVLAAIWLAERAFNFKVLPF